MKALFKGHVGGLQPKYLTRCERRTPLHVCLRFCFKAFQRLMAPFAFLKRCNLFSWSAYLLGIGRQPQPQAHFETVHAES